MGLLADIFTWWNGATIGTRMMTARRGIRVGEDEAGNVFYRNADDTRRWVIYASESEASLVSPDWHGWLHHTWAEPPTEKPLPKKAWEKPHLPNLTGTDDAYRPPGSIRTPERRADVSSDYQAWQPD